MTRCFTALELEQLALGQLSHPETATPEHLDECSFCMSNFLEYVDFYRSVSKQISSMTSEKSILESIHRPKRYLLTSLNRVEAQIYPQEIIPTLAADSRQAELKQSVENYGVYTSVDEQLMVRILKEPKGGYTLFLLADDPALYKNVLVQIVGMEQEYISDAQGQIHLGEIDMPDMDSLGIEVRTATSSYDLKSVFPAEQQFLGEETLTLDGDTNKHIGVQVLTHGKRYSLKIDLQEISVQQGPSKLRVMVVRNKELAEVKHPEQGVVTFKDILDPASVQIKIFE